jgi:hypothetical protein
MKNLLTSPSSVFLVIFFASLILSVVHTTEAEFLHYFSILMLILGLYIGYINGLAYLKTQKLVKTRSLTDFNYIKAEIASVAMLSIIIVYGFKQFSTFLNVFSKYIVGKNIFILSRPSLLPSITGLLTGLTDFFLPYVAYIFPLVVLTMYYFFVFSCIFLLPRKEEFRSIRIPRIILDDLAFELIFFFIVFSLSLWFQSLFTAVDLQQIPISLGASFIASSFRNYLEAMKNYPPT